MYWRGTILVTFFLVFAFVPSGTILGQPANGQSYTEQSTESSSKARLDLGWSDGSKRSVAGIIGYQEEGLWGLSTEKGKVVLSARYQDLVPAGQEYIIASRPGRYGEDKQFGLLTTKGDLLVPFSYSGLELCGSILIAQKLVHNQTLFSLITKDNVPLLPFSYDYIYPVSDNLFGIVQPGGKIKLVNQKANQLLQYPVDSLALTEHGYYLVIDEGKAGLVSSEGVPFITPSYKEIKFDSAQVSALELNQWEFVDMEFQPFEKRSFDDVREVGAGLYVVSIGERFWLSTAASFVHTRSYDAIEVRENGFFRVLRQGQEGLINGEGEEIIPAGFDSIYYESPFIYTLNRRPGREEWSVYDTLGILKTQYKYQAVRPFAGNRIAVKRNDRWGFIDRSGKEVVNCVFEDVASFKWRKSKVQFHGTFGVIDPYGSWIIYPGFEEINVLNDSLYIERRGRQSRLKSFDDRLIYFTTNPITPESSYLVEDIDSVTQWFVSFHGTIIDRNNLGAETVRESITAPGHFIISRGGMSSMVKGTGEVVIPFGDTQEIQDPSEGYIGVKRDDHYGFVDFQNRLRIANRYEEVGPYHNGLAAVKIRGGWGFINKDEIIVVQPVYDSVSSFHGGIARVRKEGKWGMLNLEGELIQGLKFDEIIPVEEDLWTCKANGQFGLLGSGGRSILPNRYDEITPLHNGLIIVSRNGKYGISDNDGVFKVPMVHDNIVYAQTGKHFMVMQQGSWQSFPLPRK